MVVKNLKYVATYGPTSSATDIPIAHTKKHILFTLPLEKTTPTVTPISRYGN